MAKWSMIPSAEGPFSGLDAMARYCFGLLYNRYQLSMRTHSEGDSRISEVRTVRLCDAFPYRPSMRNDTSEISMSYAFCIYTQGDLAREMGCTDRTVRRCLEDLRRAGVIETKREGYNGALRFFFPPVVYEYFEREERLKEYKAILAGREG